MVAAATVACEVPCTVSQLYLQLGCQLDVIPPQRRAQLGVLEEAAAVRVERREDGPFPCTDPNDKLVSVWI